MSRPARKSRARRPTALPHAAAPLQIVEMALADIRPHARNARQHTERQENLLTDLVRRFNYMAPLLVHVDGLLIAGHLRLAVAKRLGWRTVPVVVIGPLSAGGLETLMLADNRLPELASWDEEMLAESLELIVEDDTLDFSAELTGFEAPRIDALIYRDDFMDPDAANEQLPAVRDGPPIAQLGDVWIADQLTLVCADSLAKASWTVALAGRRADLILTDSPYNVPILGNVSARHSDFVMGAGELSEAGFTAFLTTVFQHARAHARDGAFIYAFMDGAHLYELFAAARAARLTQKALCTWAKTNAGMGAFYRSQTEHVGVFKCGGGRHRNNIELGRHGRNRTTLWAYPGMNAFGRDRAAALKLHPTVKPVGLLADAILDVTRRADLVVDPFTGSGSTLLAAHRTGRAAAGIELDPAYVDVALTRIAAITGVDPVRAADGARWSALMQQRAAGGAP